MEIRVSSQFLFDKEMFRNGLNDDNVEDTNKAYISIIGTPECLKYYLDEEDTNHYFEDHPNVLNLDFDDIGYDVIYDGHHFRTMDMEQAERSVDFIERMIDKGVECMVIHCRAGMSRSRGFAEFIYRYCIENDIDVDYPEQSYYTTLYNIEVVKRLNHAYWKKHGVMGYEDPETDYPDDIVNTKVVTININE